MSVCVRRAYRVYAVSYTHLNVLATELSGSGTDFDIVTIKDTPSYATLVEKNVLDSLDSYIEKDGVELAKFNGVTDQILVCLLYTSRCV